MDSATRSSFEEDNSPLGQDGEAEDEDVADGQEVPDEDIVFHIPDSIKHFLEDDYLNIRYHKKVCAVGLYCATIH